jgi:hypothetical protein
VYRALGWMLAVSDLVPSFAVQTTARQRSSESESAAASLCSQSFIFTQWHLPHLAVNRTWYICSQSWGGFLWASVIFAMPVDQAERLRRRLWRIFQKRHKRILLRWRLRRFGNHMLSNWTHQMWADKMWFSRRDHNLRYREKWE